MGQNVIKPKGATAESKAGAGGANLAPVPLIGIVKSNIDPTRAGRIWVYIEDNSGNDPDNRDNWKPVAFLSPFYGRTTPDAQDTGFGEYKLNPSSYGLWHSPPDIGTRVICLFVNGDMDYGFYIGCIPEPEALTMVPAIGATDNIVPNSGEAESYGGAVRLPVTNINTNNKNISDKPSYLTEPKPVHSYTAMIMNQQGIIRDPVRGPISSSAQREAASRVGFGISTPGRPIYKGGFDDTTIAQNLEKGTNPESLQVIARRGGHTFVMDDGDVIGRDNLIRIRTSLGHQLLMSDDGQTLMLLHSNGQSYIELGKEGTVDIYSTNSINLRTQGDLNLHADRNVNIQANETLNIRAKNIGIQSDEQFKQKTGKDHQIATNGKHTIKVGGAYSVEAGGDASMLSSSLAYINGSKVNLNTGKTSTTPQDVEEMLSYLQTDTLFDKKKGWIAAPAKLTTICTRAPAHAPWANAGQGVDVKTEVSASKALPSAPSAAIQSVNQAAAGSVSNPTTAATVAGLPKVGSVSGAIDRNTTGALLGQQATAAATSAASAAQATGKAVVATAQGAAQNVVAQVGKAIPQTPQQLQNAGVLKPGAATTINGLIQSGANVTSAMTNNMFTGTPGASTLTQFANNVSAQAGAVTNNLQKAQTALTNAGAITGKEAGSQIAGVINSAATAGVTQTLDTIKNVAGNPAGAISGIANQAGGALSGTLSAIGGGNFAGNLAEKALGGLGSLDQGIKALNKVNGIGELQAQTKGVVAGAFDSIKATFEPMKAGVPQNLTQLAEERAKKIASAAGSLPGQAASALDSAKSAIGSAGSVQGLAGTVAGKASQALTTAQNAAANVAGQVTSGLTKASPTGGASVTNALSSSVTKATATVTSTVNQVTSAASSFTNVNNLTQGATSKLIGAATSTAGGAAASLSSSLASGVGALPGGQGAISAITNEVTGKLTNIKGQLDNIKSAATNLATGSLNNIKVDGLENAQAGLAAFAKAGLPAGAAAQIQASISAIGQSGGSPIKMPSIGVNTVDRSEIDSQITEVLADPVIPKPNFAGEVSEEAKEKLGTVEQRVDEYIKKSSELFAQIDAVDAKQSAAFDAWNDARKNLPKGDPKIEQLRLAALAIQQEKKPLNEQLDQLFIEYDDVYDLAQKKKYG